MALGVAAITFFGLHLLLHLRLGDPANVLWACHVASLLIGIGGVACRPSLVGVGVLWLVVGIPLWFYHLAVDGTFVPTSLLTHFGGAIVGGLLLYHLGLPHGLWWKSLLALIALVATTRFVTVRQDNINLAFDIHGRHETPIMQHSLYLLTLALVITTVFVIAELILHRVFPLHEILSDRQSD